MPVNATERKYLSELIKGVSTFDDDNATNFHYQGATVGGSATIDNIGTPVIWNNSASRFEVYVAQNISTAISTGGSPLKDGSVIGVVVGDAFGVGFNKKDTDLSEGDVTLTLLYRGDASVISEGFEWGSANAGAQEAFLAQLEAQRITTVTNATVVTPSFTS